MNAQIQPDIKRPHTVETQQATMYAERGGECDYCGKVIAHYLIATIWIAADGSESLIHTKRCVGEMIADAVERRSVRRKAHRAGR